MYRLCQMIVFIIVLVTQVPLATCKKVTQCELAVELRRQLSQGDWRKDLGEWICIASNMGLDTQRITGREDVSSTRHYGIFQINNQWWCTDGAYPTNNCKLKCSSLRDDDISDDVRCAIFIKNQQTFSAWAGSHEGCEDESDPFNEDAFNETCGRTSHVAPAIDKSVLEVTFSEGAKNKMLNCTDLSGNDRTRLKWKYDEEEFHELQSLRSNKEPNIISLRIPEVHTYFNNKIFKCEAENPFGNDSHRFRLKVTAAQVFPYFLVIGLVVLILILGILGGLLFMYMFRRLAVRLNGLTKAEIREFLQGQPENLAVQYSTTDSNSGIQGHENSYVDPRNRPYDRKYELAEDKLLKSGIIGEGQYGFVTKAVFDGRPVAVKSVKANADKLYIKALLDELKIIIYLGASAHVVGLVGAITDKLSKGVLHIVVEFCEHGDLQNYLRARKASSSSDAPNERVLREYENAKQESITFTAVPVEGAQKEYENTKLERITTDDLIRWCEQIAKGMQHLASKNVIHGDLAARNVLLDSNRNVKITDFGLSRRMYDYTNYVKKQQAPLPWRHMSIESLRHMSFSTESDVWAYGVTMWEIFSLGDVPYSGRSWSLDFADELDGGLRLLQPNYSPNFIYNKMMACWNRNKDLRPTFQALTDLNAEYLYPEARL